MVNIPIVVAANFVIGVLCLIAAYGLWRVKKLMKRLTRLAEVGERNVHRLLHGAPTNIMKGKEGMATLRNKYNALQPQMARLQQIISLLTVTRFFWGRFLVTSPPNKRR